MGLAYRTLYRLGVTPWDQPDPSGPVVELLDALPPGAMLDVGCGTGRDAVHAASRGWRVTGVDAVPRALDAARERAAAAGAEVRLLRADIGRISPDELGSGYTLVLDIECLHGLPAGARRTAAATIDAVTAPGAHLQMLAFAPRHGPGPSGLDEAGVSALFPRWRVTRRPATDIQLVGMMRNAEPYWYRLVKP